jgi:hypothetical protein
MVAAKQIRFDECVAGGIGVQLLQLIGMPSPRSLPRGNRTLKANMLAVRKQFAVGTRGEPNSQGKGGGHGRNWCYRSAVATSSTGIDDNSAA